MVYLKTTETCQLNCKHCFTNGINGAKVYFNPEKTIDWIKRLRLHYPSPDDSIHFEFHGGEPFLAPISHMRKVYDAVKDYWDRSSFGITSNFVFKLKDEHFSFIEECLGSRVGTSYDPVIRFENKKQLYLWEDNVRKLKERGYTVKLFVSITKDTIKFNPKYFLEYFKELQIDEVSFERLTHHGNANKHPDIFPTNKEIDKWYVDLHKTSEELGARDWFDNETLEVIYSKFETGFKKGGTFCRDCEQKLFTINATGTISGCPNAAPEEIYGHINDDIKTLINSPKRLHLIAEEAMRNPNCYNCEVFEFCGGDCHQLTWEGNICGAPKTLMRNIKRDLYGT